MTSYQLYLSESDLEVWKAFKEIAKRENKELAQIIKEMVAQYVKAHGQGNPTYQIDKWVKEPAFKAYPTIDSDWEQVDLSAFDDKDIKHLINKASELSWFIKQEARKRDLIR